MAKEQYQTRVDDDVHERIQEFKKEREIETKSEAIRRLVVSGLDAQSEPVEAELATDGSGFEKINELGERVNRMEEQQTQSDRADTYQHAANGLGIAFILLYAFGFVGGLPALGGAVVVLLVEVTALTYSLGVGTDE